MEKDYRHSYRIRDEEFYQDFKTAFGLLKELGVDVSEAYDSENSVS